MALTYNHRPGGSDYCPECKEPISREANICPHCRSDLKNNAAWQERKQSKSGCAMNALLMFFGLAALLGGIAYAALA